MTKRCSSPSPSPSTSKNPSHVQTSPTKRRRLSPPQTQTQPDSPSQSPTRPTTPETPDCDRFTPFPFACLSQLSSPTRPSQSSQNELKKPIDTPSNPFGRKRSLVAKLPPRTGFGKHVVLRMCLASESTRSSRGIGRGGRRRSTYHDGPKVSEWRVVQVPLSYTFQHLRVLLAFLFPSLSSPEDDKERDDHLFKVLDCIDLYKIKSKSGLIKLFSSGARKNRSRIIRNRVRVCLSSSRDPYRWKGEWDYEDDVDEDDVFASSGSHSLGLFDEMGSTGLFGKQDNEEEYSDEDEEDTKWEAEEDFTIEHVWSGGDADTGIIYYHSPQTQTQIHITLNNTRVQRRKGKGNTPFVFDASPCSSSPSGSGSRRASNSSAEDDDEQSDEEAQDTDEAQEEAEEEEENPDPRLEQWNAPNAFEAFFTSHVEAESLQGGKTLYRHAVASSTSLAETTDGELEPESASSPPKSSPFPSSSPFSSSSPTKPSSLFSSSPSKPSPSSLFSISPSLSSPKKPSMRPLPLPLKTPAYPRAQRKRLAYITKRIERSKSRTGSRNTGVSGIKERLELNDDSSEAAGCQSFADDADSESDGSGDGEGANWSSSRGRLVTRRTNGEGEVDEEMVDQLENELAQQDDDDEDDGEKRIQMIDGRFLTFKEAMEEVRRGEKEV
ncbi:hypothetical protein VNI00_006239 [Paramarasmius palmivorus]|uniref:Uncharacterized protein n=1 Tax=Paramarasmius palmivorus TaxID=297713 RepID=A0AAW0DAD9_9AGAR